MKTLLIFTLFLISAGGGESEIVPGYSGGGVLIKCRYETQYTSNQKYFCKSPWFICADQIKTDVKNEWINSGRFSLFDDTRAAQVWVLITELTVEDTGLYLCGVEKNLDMDIHKLVALNVQEDQDYEKSISVTGHVGGGVNISCKYPQSHSINPKFLCRRVGFVDCSYETSVNESRRWINEGNLHLHDDGKQIFTVSFNNLTEGDSGEYWCGAESYWTSDPAYQVYITKINLRVTAFPVSSVVTGVSVVLLLLLIGLLFFIVTFRKRRKTRGAETVKQSSRESTGNYENNPTLIPLHPRENTTESDSIQPQPQPNPSEAPQTATWIPLLSILILKRQEIFLTQTLEFLQSTLLSVHLQTPQIRLNRFVSFQTLCILTLS
ncbi:hypothetical protein MHYP_G00103780 [Metynnis hypsauchen]